MVVSLWALLLSACCCAHARLSPVNVGAQPLGTKRAHGSRSFFVRRTAQARVVELGYAAEAVLRPLSLQTLRERASHLPWCVGCGAAGAVSTSVTHSVMHPLDVLKIKMQSDVALAGLSTREALRAVSQREGLRQLWAGFNANAVGYFAQGFFKFGLYEFNKRTLSAAIERHFPDVDVSRNRYRVPIWIASSAAAEVVACVVLCPLEATKIRLVTDPTYACGAAAALTRVVSDEGALALFRGLYPIMLRQVPYTVVKLAGYEALSTVMGAGVAMGALRGIVAGACAAAFSQPGDVILSKLCGGSTSARMASCAISVSAVVSSLTLPELFVGLAPRAAVCAAICAGQFFLYENLRPKIQRNSTSSP